MLSSLSFLVSFAVLGMLHFAQANTPEFGAKQIADYGLIAVAFLFILYRIEPQLRGVTKAVNDLTQMIGYMLSEIKETSPVTRHLAQTLMARKKAEEEAKEK